MMKETSVVDWSQNVWPTVKRSNFFEKSSTITEKGRKQLKKVPPRMTKAKNN
jgi:hypothetical protein